MKVTDNIDFGEIVYCNLTLQSKDKKTITLKEVVFSFPYEKKYTTLEYKDKENNGIMQKCGKKEDLLILNIDIIERLGYKHKGKGFTEAKKNDNNNRNEKTGSYD